MTRRERKHVRAADLRLIDPAGEADWEALDRAYAREWEALRLVEAEIALGEELARAAQDARDAEELATDADLYRYWRP
jgi:hypothetical protein